MRTYPKDLRTLPKEYQSQDAREQNVKGRDSVSNKQPEAPRSLSVLVTNAGSSVSRPITIFSDVLKSKDSTVRTSPNPFART